jgi:energy-coupling factor transport system substrate-specific component
MRALPARASADGALSARAVRLTPGLILALTSLLGLAAFLYPFFLPVLPATNGAMMAHAADAPLLTVVLIGLCLITALAGLNAQQMTSKMTAMLGILVALNAVLRALPGPAGFSALFVLPILTGYAYGPTFGFLLGALSLLVSALIGGGVGPWLPYQMFATAWVGMLSGLLPGGKGPGSKAEPLLLAVWGAVLGFVFGAIMNLWFWPFLVGAIGGSALPLNAASGSAASDTWHPGLALWPTLRAYLVFYVATSLWWDLGRAAGNGFLILILARPVLRVLRRFRNRFRFDVISVVEIADSEI